MNLSEEQPALDSSTPLMAMRSLLNIPRKIKKVGVSFGSNSLVPWKFSYLIKLIAHPRTVLIQNSLVDQSIRPLTDAKGRESQINNYSQQAKLFILTVNGHSSRKIIYSYSKLGIL